MIGILIVRHLGGGPPLNGNEMRLAIGMSELAAFVQARRSGVTDLGTWPEDSIALVDAIPCDPVVIGDATFGGDAQFLEMSRGDE